MFKLLSTLFAGILLVTTTPAAHAEVVVGEAAPEIHLTDVHGKDFKLSDHKGKIVVLEWSNHECPYVVKHYDTKNMQKTQQYAMDKGVEWVTIVSSGEGRQGHTTAAEAIKIAEDAGAHITTKLQDVSGEIGHAYGAKTTPHMFVIDANGVVAYTGAIDDNSSPRHETVEGAHNYVMAAIDNLQAGEPVKDASTPPYGCGVKYAH